MVNNVGVIVTLILLHKDKNQVCGGPGVEVLKDQDTGALHDRNNQYAVFFNWQQSFAFLSAGTFYQLEGECCQSSYLLKCTSEQGNFHRIVV